MIASIAWTDEEGNRFVLGGQTSWLVCSFHLNHVVAHKRGVVAHLSRLFWDDVLSHGAECGVPSIVGGEGTSSQDLVHFGM